MLLPAVQEMQRHYRSLRVPTVIVAGKDDRYVSTDAHSARLHRDIAASELVLVPGAGHMVHHTAAGRVMQALEAEPALRERL